MNLRVIYYYMLSVIVIFTISCGDRPNESSSVQMPVKYLPRPLPSKFIGLFLPVSPIKGNNLYVDRESQKASSYGINVINLIVDWKDLEPQNGVYDFTSLHTLIKTIRSNGHYCILRIYFNAGTAHQSMPMWFESSVKDYYVNDGITNPLPWDTSYLQKLESLLGGLNSWFVSNDIAYPDTIQIAAGGDYGEIILESYTSTPSEYLWMLIPAVKNHIDIHARVLTDVASDLIISVNALSRSQDLAIPQYAIGSGYKWIQINAGACFLRDSIYAPDTIYLLKSIKGYNSDISLILEDESKSDCQLSEYPVNERVSILNSIKGTEGIFFNGVTLNIEDLTEGNRAGITLLNTYLGF